MKPIRHRSQKARSLLTALRSFCVVAARSSGGVAGGGLGGGIAGGCGESGSDGGDGLGGEAAAA